MVLKSNRKIKFITYNVEKKTLAQNTKTGKKRQMHRVIMRGLIEGTKKKNNKFLKKVIPCCFVMYSSESKYHYRCNDDLLKETICI